ncbi:hypothetical protein [Floccifex sp.]|uniref:hypothetical protein n=1 Tax=Floccifex sp. TaxID=2815810 RepID=UPI002A757FF1|nr:hypothetical protein [Floccifex sp.]MDD7281011.1 hypothetical protein [Erysipelotrichaceae bacterium]MDY2959096.1 hypothetical protein [Floccifex sp.]
MSKKQVYASLEIADQEVRLVVLEVFDGRYNVLRTEKAACSGIENQKIVDEASVVMSIREVMTNAQAALGYRIERVLLAIPSLKVQRNNQRVHIQIEDGTRTIRLFHVQQGYNKAIQRKASDEVEFVNMNRIIYEVNGMETKKLPLQESCDDFYMNVDLLYADKETIYSYAKCVEQANLEILDLCLDSYAIAQQTACLEMSYDRMMIQLDLEANHCTLSVFSKGRLMNTTSLNTGYNWFTSELKEKYNLSDDICYRLLQNLFHSDESKASDIIVYIGQNDENRVEITEKELMESCMPKIRSWIAQINETCAPIVKQSKSRYILTGQGSNINAFKELTGSFNAEAIVYQETCMGARDGSYVCGLGMVYAWKEINKIRSIDKISPNNNELEASIDAISQQSHKGDGGFTKKLKNVILTERK